MDPKLIRQYAEFAVKIGVNPQPGRSEERRVGKECM